MKNTKTLFLILAVTAGLSCSNDEPRSIPEMGEFSLYWSHKGCADGGRRYEFVLSTVTQFDNRYDLEFNKSIVGNIVTISLKQSIDKGKCPFYPMPSDGTYDPEQCHATGGFFLSEEELGEGVYSLKIVMPEFEVTSELTVTDEKATLTIPPSEFLSSTTEEVYPDPC